MEVLHISTSEETALRTLPAQLQQWFLDQFGSLTAGQRLAWPAIASGRSLLLSAPTGTGKTLAAMVPILARLITQPSFASSVRCLYLAPLKALTNDLQRNLHAHLTSMAPWLEESAVLPLVGCRTGDTSHAERRQVHEEPPEILLTTPESLAVLLSRPDAVDLFAELQWVVVDEIHALAGNKRGADLSLSLERLQRLTSHDLQRIGLSATSTPLTETAQFLVGTDRDCTIACVDDPAPLDLCVIPLHREAGFLMPLIDHLSPILTGEEAPQSTLIFTNNRALAERLSWALRRRFPQWVDQIAVHHSSLAGERRRDVEQSFKQGRLRVIVSSTSLELGIDIGSVELVVMVHPPGGVVRLLQRVGRAGHAPGLPRRGILFTADPSELLEAAVTIAASWQGQCEPLQIVAYPLDVLCQQLVGMASCMPWSVEEAFLLARSAYPYQSLTMDDFQDCLAYLLGHPSHDDPDEWLPARLREEDGQYRILNQRTARLIRRNLGTILAEIRCNVLMETAPLEDKEGLPDHILIGQVDEAFAENLSPGDYFLLDGRCLLFRRLEHSSGNQGTPSMHLIVQEVVGKPFPPRWAGEGVPMSTELARRLFVLRAAVADALREGPDALYALLEHDYGMTGQGSEDLAHYFERQEALSEIPPPAVLLIEHVPNVMGADYYLHTPLNRAGNDAIARVLTLRMEQEYGSVTSIVADLGFALQIRNRSTGLTMDAFRALLSPDGFPEDLHRALLRSLFLRSRFQNVAYTGLMLLRNPQGGRRRVGGREWGAQQLFEQISQEHPDFVLLRQAMREVQQDACNQDAAMAFLTELQSMTIRCRQLREPSPFVEQWTQMTSTEDATPSVDALRKLHARLMGEEQ